MVNNSQKPISDFDLHVTYYLADGTSEDEHRTVDTQGHPLAPGAEWPVSIGASKPGVAATVDVVLYTDGTSDVSNQLLYRAIMASKKGTIRGLEKANELVAAALADPKEQHPTVTVINQIKALNTAIEKKNLQIDDPAAWESLGLNHALVNIQNALVTPVRRTPAEEAFLQERVKSNESEAARIRQEVRP